MSSGKWRPSCFSLNVLIYKNFIPNTHSVGHHHRQTQCWHNKALCIHGHQPFSELTTSSCWQACPVIVSEPLIMGNQWLLKTTMQLPENKWLQETTLCVRILWHDDVIKWKSFPRYWPFVPGIHQSPVNSPHKCQWRRALMFSLICVWINGWVKNRKAGDLRRYRTHYDVIVMGNLTLTCSMMTSCLRNTFCITGPLWGESSGHVWIPLTKG